MGRRSRPPIRFVKLQEKSINYDEMSDTNDTPRFRFSNLARVRLRRRPEPDSDDPSTPRRRRRKRCSFPSDPNTRVGVYVAMAHAGLVLTLAIFFALVKLLQGYWRPIQWAILCSMPLRELHISLVSFWSYSLRLGLLPSILALPLAALRALSASLLHLLRPPSHLGFPDLVQWLASFAIFLFAYEHVGLLSVPLLLLPCFVAYASGYNPSPLSQVIVPEIDNSPFLTKIGHGVTSVLLRRLKTMVGVGLILMLVVGSVLGFFFFSYKIGVEGKEAVLSLKEHMDRNNYPARIGLRKWMDEKHILDLIDAYSTKLYDTVSHNIDQLAMQYNVTDILDGVKHDFTKPQTTMPKNVSIDDREVNFRSSSKSMDWKVIYRDKDDVFRELMKLIGREDLRERMKVLLLQSIDVTKQVVGSVTMFLVGGANLLLFTAVSILYGAAEVVNIIYEVTVFIWLLYYLMTTETGGVMDHVTGMLPVARGTRERCGQVLDEAVKSVLVAAAKMAFFQGCWTYLLFRFYRIHFLYVSTLVAIMTGVLPIMPCWIASIPAAGQLAVEGKYVEAIALTALHFLVLEYGTIHIQQDEIPAHNAYLTGLSIFGGIALFPSYFEGAIMGPLLMTVMIALKNLYVEFVLASAAAVS